MSWCVTKQRTLHSKPMTFRWSAPVFRKLPANSPLGRGRRHQPSGWVLPVGTTHPCTPPLEGICVELALILQRLLEVSLGAWRGLLEILGPGELQTGNSFLQVPKLSG